MPGDALLARRRVEFLFVLIFMFYSYTEICYQGARKRKIVSMHHLVVALFATKDASYSSMLGPYLAKANALLKPFAMEVEIYPTNPLAPDAGKPRVLAYTGAVFDSAGDPGTVRSQCHTAVPNGRGIPVVFCKRNTDTATAGGTEYGSTILKTNTEANGGVQWLPYILINTQEKSESDEVLLHEMIHAAHGKTVAHDADKTSAFYDYGSTTTKGEKNRKLPANHADILRKAYFAAVVP